MWLIFKCMDTNIDIDVIYIWTPEKIVYNWTQFGCLVGST